jgi:Domain of unknown function (DUF4185)
LKSFAFDTEARGGSEQLSIRVSVLRATWLALIPLLLLRTGSPQSTAPANTQQSSGLPDFSYTQGWLGADDAYSVPLGAHKSLWLFGDTFVGSKTTEQRSQAKVMARNSIGISVCAQDKNCTMRYFWRNPDGPKPRSFFDTGTDDLWYWPLDGFVHGKTLYVSLLAVRNKPGATSNDAFGFEIAGTKLAIVKDIRVSPEKWLPVVQDLSDEHLWIGVSIVRDGGYLIWYTQVSGGEGRGYMTALRTPVKEKPTSASAWQYLKQDGQWVPGLPRDDAARLIDQPISEMSVRFHRAIHKWVALSTGPEFPSPRAVARLADSAIGPWSAPQTIFEFPETKVALAGYDKDTFCYAVKEHVEFTESKIALTYACNSMVVAKAIANMQIYRPRTIVLDLPK